MTKEKYPPRCLNLLVVVVVIVEVFHGNHMIAEYLRPSTQHSASHDSPNF